ncbi:peptide ABC transporter substrate-binding protein [uncultured Clostridium sp.]|uniref:peptide ABC transporter substrate-binding protein n=1 Tax=uncultured Clostridium sp. TaxID=59620 RepID=UPI00262F5F85|nr:peptide ABC transporter substrate-binding protein [uncultured Clostridium sp.]
MRKKIIALVFVIPLILFTFTACRDSSKDESNNKKTLKLVTGAIKTLDSVKGSDTVSFNIIQNTQENLLLYKDNKIVQGTAESYTVSNDKRTYTFKLRPDLKWSDGKPLTSKDYKYAWMRLLDPKTGGSYSFFLFGVQNAEQYFKNEVPAESVGIETPDDQTIIVKLSEPISYFTQIIAFPSLAPQREDIVNKYGSKYGSGADTQVYSGPFMVSEWQKGGKINLVKNPYYWNTKDIQLDNVKFTEIKEPNTVYKMFVSNQIDAMAGSGEYLKPLKSGAQEGKWSEINEVGSSVFYTQYNLKSENKLLSNKNIRLALSIAVNREGLTEKVLKRNIPAYGLVPSGIQVGDIDYRKEVSEPLKTVMDENPKELFIKGLKELGLDPDPSKYNISYLLQNSDATSKMQGEYMQNTWKKEIGVNITLVTSADFSDFLNKVDNGEFEMASAGWGADYNDPMTFLDLFTPENGSNYGGYNDERVNSLLKSLQGVTNNEEKLKVYKEVEKIEVVDNPAVAPSYYTDVYSFQHNNVKGLELPRFGGTYQLRWTSIS